MRRRPRLAWAIAALLLVQWGAAFAHVSAAPAHLMMDICGADGSVTRVAMPLGDDGSDGHDPAEASVGHCPLCTAPSALGLPPAPPGIVLPLSVARAISLPTPPAQCPTPAPRDLTQPRAPPIS